MSYLLHARAVGHDHYCEIHVVRETSLAGHQVESLHLAMRHLLRAATPEPIALHNIEVGIAELPFVDSDCEAGGDPGGKLLLPDTTRRMGTAAS